MDHLLKVTQQPSSPEPSLRFCRVSSVAAAAAVQYRS